MNEKYWARLWYGTATPSIHWRALSGLFAGIVRFRRWAYRIGLKRKILVPAPVIVVGNLTVGGTGKTPLVAWLVEQLAAKGYRPGIVCRGYRGKAKTWPQTVTAASDPKQVGDEAVWLSEKTGAKVVAGPNRARAARHLVAEFGCDVIVSDDGLQHYALARTVEIAVIDGARGFGNGWLLPAGPLREPASRLHEVDFVVVNGEACRDLNLPVAKLLEMRFELNNACNLSTGETRRLEDFTGETVTAIAGIGHPQRFFQALRGHGLTLNEHAFPDHHAFSADDLAGLSGALLMTEKDAVKCRAFAGERCWSVPVTVTFTQNWLSDLLLLLKKNHG